MTSFDHLTPAGGYSSTLFHLLYRFAPEIRNDFKHHEQARWIDRYGFRQRKYRSKDGADEPFEHGRGSGRRGYRQTEKETPGLAPAALFHIIGNTVFLRLCDVSSELPVVDIHVARPADHEGYAFSRRHELYPLGLFPSAFHVQVAKRADVMDFYIHR